MKVDIIQLEQRKIGSFDCPGNGYIYTATDALELFVQMIGSKNVEQVAQICLDNTNRIINYSVIALGTVTNVNISIAQIIKVALLSNSSKIMIAHNHPSRILKITEEDIRLTKHIGWAARIMGIQLLDSVIVNMDGNITSIRSHLKEI